MRKACCVRSLGVCSQQYLYLVYVDGFFGGGGVRGGPGAIFG